MNNSSNNKNNDNNNTETLPQNRKIWNMNVTLKTNCCWYARYTHQRMATGTLELGNKRENGDNQKYSIIKRSSGDRKRLAVT